MDIMRFHKILQMEIEIGSYETSETHQMMLKQLDCSQVSFSDASDVNKGLFHRFLVQ